MKKEPKIKSIIFDFDGVLVDSYQIAYKIAERIYPGLTQKEYKKMFNENYYQYEHKRRPDISINFFKEYLKHEDKLIVDNQDQTNLEMLSKKNFLSINSSNINYVLQRVLENNNVLSFFSKLYGSDVEKRKTKKFKMLFKDLQIEPNQCLFIADTVGDILEAKDVNVKSLAYVGNRSYHSKNQLKKAKPYGYIENLSEIFNFIKD